MQMKYIIGVIAAAMIGQAQASHVVTHPSQTQSNTVSVEKRAMMPGYCQVELLNHSPYVLTVNGVFDDNSTFWFQMYPNDSAYYVDLLYYSVCHPSVYLTISSPFGVVYQGYAAPGASLEYVTGLAGNQMKVSHK